MMDSIKDAWKHPLEFAKVFWPNVTFYREQKEIILSVRDNDETFVPAGNMLGKDFVAAFIVLWYFLSRHPCKILTTSVKERHLNVLWGEIDKFIRICKFPLEHSQGGPLIVNNDGIKKVVNGRIHKDSYVMRTVADDQSMDSFSGHHVTPDPGQPIDLIPRNMFVGDEASGLPDAYYLKAKTWAKRTFIFGNTWPCDNFFKRAIKGNPLTKDPGGDLLAPNKKYFYRKILKICAEDSPNVRYARSLIKKHGEEEMNRRDLLKMAILIPGVIPYLEYMKRRKNWSAFEQCVSLDAEFYEGDDVFLFPAEWLNYSERLARKIEGQSRRAKVIGVDPAEGGDDTSMSAVDALGLIEQVSKKTPDTSVVTGETLAFMRKHNVRAENVLFDAGGGGKQHADRLRSQGYQVRTVSFGASAMAEKRRGMKRLEETKLQDETRYIYKNRRVEMYHLTSLKMDPAEGKGFAIPAKYVELRRQLAVMPKNIDGEGRLWLPPKNKRDSKDTGITLKEMLGCSPDEADSLVLAVYGLVYPGRRSVAGVAF